jgi:hypothetical protein
LSYDTIALRQPILGQGVPIIYLADDHTLIAGINGDPLALAAIAGGRMAFTVETSVDDLAHQAVDLALRAARGEALPPHFSYQMLQGCSSIFGGG